MCEWTLSRGTPCGLWLFLRLLFILDSAWKVSLKKIFSSRSRSSSQKEPKSFLVPGLKRGTSSFPRS